MMKRLLVFVCIIALVCPLAACHGSAGLESFEMPESFDAGREYEITFWAKNDTNLAQVNIYKKAIEDFEKIYPNIHVVLRLYTNYNDIYNDVITNITTGTTPNVCISYPDHIATYLTGENVMVPLDELMMDEKYGLGGSEVQFDAPIAAEVVPQFLEEGRIDGISYALPYMRSTEACYVNKTFVESLGFTVPDKLTWEFVWEVSEYAMSLGKKTVTNEKGEEVEVFAANGQDVLIPFVYKSVDNMMIQMLRQLDAGYSTDDGEILIFNESTKDVLYTVADHVKTRAFSIFAVDSYPADLLNAGQCIFAIDSTAGATWMGADAPLNAVDSALRVEFETVVREIPQFDTEQPQMISQGPSVCLFNKEDPQEVMASWLFMQFLLTNDVQIAYSQTEGYLPVTTKAQNSQEYQDYLSRAGEDNDLYYSVKIQAAELLLNNIDNTFVTPVFNGSASLRNAAGQMIVNVTKSVRRKETIDEAYMQKLFADVTALYRLDQIGASSIGLQKDLGPLPSTATVLLWSLAGAWVAIGAYALVSHVKKKS